MTPAPRPCARSGFTFLETVIALAIASLLVTVAAHSLMTVFRADRTADRLLEGSLLLRRVAAHHYRGSDLAQSPDAWPAGWTLAAETVTSGGGADASNWLMVRCGADALVLEVAFRQP